MGAVRRGGSFCRVAFLRFTTRLSVCVGSETASGDCLHFPPRSPFGTSALVLLKVLVVRKPLATLPTCHGEVSLRVGRCIRDCWDVLIPFPRVARRTVPRTLVCSFLVLLAVLVAVTVSPTVRTEVSTLFGVASHVPRQVGTTSEYFPARGALFDTTASFTPLLLWRVRSY